MRLIPFQEWRPDSALYHDAAAGPSGGPSPTANNVVPRDKTSSGISYGPFPSLVNYSGGLDARCQGAFGVLAQDGSVHQFAGDASKLYTLTLSSPNWSNISKVGGYTVAAEDSWSWDSYGDQIFATQLGNPIQSYLVGVSTAFADLSASAPKAKYIAVVKDFVFAANINDAVSGLRPQRVQWSGIGDPSNWPTPGTATAAQVESDFQDLPGSHGAITGVVSNVGQNDAVIFFERAIYAVRYVGPPAIFSFTPVLGAKGTYSPRSIVKEGGVVYYLAEDGFRVFDGSTTQPIGANRVDRAFRTECPPAAVDRVVGASDPTTKSIMWAYPGLGSSNSVPNTVLAYSWPVNAWSSATGFQVEHLMRAPTFGFSLDTLSALYPDINSVPFSLDSPAWAGNSILLAGFDAQHRLGYFSGPALAPVVETPVFSISDGDKISSDQRGAIVDSRPAFDGALANPSVTMGSRETVNQPLTYSPPVWANANGNCPQRVSGRYFSATLQAPAGSVFEHLLGVEVEVRQQGRR